MCVYSEEIDQRKWIMSRNTSLLETGTSSALSRSLFVQGIQSWLSQSRTDGQRDSHRVFWETIGHVKCTRITAGKASHCRVLKQMNPTSLLKWVECNSYQLWMNVGWHCGHNWLWELELSNQEHMGMPIKCSKKCDISSHLFLSGDLQW